jgi:putative oxidoreductase
VPVVGVLLALDMLGAYLFVHAGNGLFVEKNGYELVLTLGAAGLLLAAVGPGRYSLDHVLFGHRRSAATPSSPVRA